MAARTRVIGRRRALLRGLFDDASRQFAVPARPTAAWDRLKDAENDRGIGLDVLVEQRPGVVTENVPVMTQQLLVHADVGLPVDLLLQGFRLG